MADNIIIPTTDVVEDLSKIDDHLADLYRRTADAEGAGSSVPVVRTLLLNLIIYVSRSDAMAEAANDVAEVMGSHPCRAIIVSLDGPGSTKPAATVSAVCGITERGDRRLCGEIIELRAGGMGDAIVGMVMPLLVPDVPVFVWAPGNAPCSREEFRAVADVADHVIIDSRGFADLRTGLESMPPLCTRPYSPPYEGGAGGGVQDLCWISLHPWRDLAAQHFDPPMARRYLARLTGIEVKFNPGERADAPPAAALLIASWLMECTGMDIACMEREESGGFRIDARQDDRPVDIRLAPEDLGYAPGTLNSVTIRGGDESGMASFVTHRVSDTRISATEECAGICFAPMVVEFPIQSAPSLVREALDTYGKDQVYEDAMAVEVCVLSRMVI